MRIEVTPEAADDLVRGFEFYEQQESGLGDVFIDALVNDLTALSGLAGVHRMVHGEHRYLSKRFPHAIYYAVQQECAVVQAILDCRSDPGVTAARLR